MVERLATTPFGGASACAQNFALRAEMERRQQRLRSSDGDTNTPKHPEKWQLIRALSEARDSYGLSDRSIVVLEALTSFHQDRLLDGRNPIIVFPSNAELSIRARGMSPATLRRHLAALVEIGLIFRRDSANGKRFCHRDQNGDVENAFGFDLAPLALRADEILARANSVRQQARLITRLRLEITLHLRDIAKMVSSAFIENRAGDWDDLANRLEGLSGRFPRRSEVGGLESRRDALMSLRLAVESAYHQALDVREMSASESDIERHIQTSEIESHFEKSVETSAHVEVQVNEGKRDVAAPNVNLEHFLKTCPQISDYARNGVKNWTDVLTAADTVKTMLGVSPTAWSQAQQAMGQIPAAIVIAAMLERAETIRSPGGYLRDLSLKAQRGRFSIHPMLQALRNPATVKLAFDLSPRPARMTMTAIPLSQIFRKERAG